MKLLANILAVLGILLFVYAIIARFVNGPTAFGYIYPLDPKTVVLGAVAIMLISVLIYLNRKK